MTYEHEWSEAEYRVTIRQLEAERDELLERLASATRALVRMSEIADNEVHDIRVMLGETGEHKSVDKP